MHKVVYVNLTEPLVLSDCVIALRSTSKAHTLSAYRHIIKHWSRIQDYYGGTCAQYITIGGLIEALAAIGIISAARNFEFEKLISHETLIPTGPQRKRKATVSI